MSFVLRHNVSRGQQPRPPTTNGGGRRGYESEGPGEGRHDATGGATTLSGPPASFWPSGVGHFVGVSKTLIAT